MTVARMFGRFILPALALIAAITGPAWAAGEVHVITVHGVINPVSARHIEKNIALAEAEGAEALIIELDTPGGLLKSVHEISKTILNAGLPVIVYVSPEGSRATSAGVLVTISAHVAAMARGTHIGAAHVVGIQGSIPDSVVSEKAMNDWVAELQAVAKLRGRNVEWVELAARESKSLTVEEAVEMNVVDLMATNIDSLLAAVDSMVVEVAGNEVTLETADAVIVRIELSARDRFLNVVTDPSVAYILFLLGIYGLIFELSNPGSIVPGVVGAICIIVALYALHTLPVNYAGVLLILLAIALFIAEIKIPSYGLLTLGGVTAMILGSIMLLERAGPLFKVSWSVIIPTVLFTVAFFFFAVSKGLLAQRRKPETGVEGLVGEIGEVMRDLDPLGKVFLHGEYWDAESVQSIREGESIRVMQVRGMRLIVQRSDEPTTGGEPA